MSQPTKYVCRWKNVLSARVVRQGIRSYLGLKRWVGGHSSRGLAGTKRRGNYFPCPTPRNSIGECTSQAIIQVVYHVKRRGNHKLPFGMGEMPCSAPSTVPMTSDCRLIWWQHDQHETGRYSKNDVSGNISEMRLNYHGAIRCVREIWLQYRLARFKLSAAIFQLTMLLYSSWQPRCILADSRCEFYRQQCACSRPVTKSI